MRPRILASLIFRLVFPLASPLACALILTLIWALLFSSPLPAKRTRPENQVIAIPMEYPRHGMVAIACQLNGDAHLYLCVIDSGATFTVVSGKLLKPEGPLVDLATAAGPIQVHQSEIVLSFAPGLGLKSKAFVQPNMKLQDVDILVGQDVLRQFRSVVFNYEKQLVEFHR